MVSRRNFMKYLTGAVAGISLGIGSDSVDASTENVKKYIDISYCFQKLNLKEELNSDESKALFDYYVSIWYEFNSPDTSTNGKIRIIKKKLESNGYNFILGILYMANSDSNLYEEKGFVLKSNFKDMFDNLKTKHRLAKKNMPDDLRILFLAMRDKYYSVLVKNYLHDNLNNLLKSVDSEILWFNHRINEIKAISLRRLMNDKEIDFKEYPSLIKKDIINYIYSKNDSQKLVLRLIKHVDLSGLEVSDVNIHKMTENTQFTINSNKLNPNLRENINVMCKKLKVNSKLINLLCMIETSYGLGKSTSHAGARGPIQVMPRTYKRFTNKENFSSASDNELIEAGILNLINFMKRLDIDVSEDKKYSYIDIFMIGVSYNAGLDSLYNLVKKKNYSLNIEPINYHQYLYFLEHDVVKFT